MQRQDGSNDSSRVVVRRVGARIGAEDRRIDAVAAVAAAGTDTRWR